VDEVAAMTSGGVKMKAVSIVALLVLQAGLAAASTSLCIAQNLSVQKAAPHAAAQNPLTALENEAKEKAAEAALTKVLNDNLPLTLNAKDVYPTVTALPGGPFSPTPLKLTADQLNQPLAPGDYTINTLDFCSEYSVHQPGAGLAYVLGPYEGKAAGAIGALIWRGTEQYNIAPGNLQAVSWAIQSGLTYDQMPKSYQAIIDQVIPDLKSEITGDFVTSLENTYSSLAKAASLPPLDTILAKLGEPGQLALDAEKQRQILTAQNTSDELKQQTLFQGQESGIYTPVSAESGPWTERVKGLVYMKLLIAGGNMTSNNVMQIRVMPAAATTARNARRVGAGDAHLVRAAYGEPQATPAVDNSPMTMASVMEGTLGYSQGRGAQALGQVAVVQQGPPPPPPPVVAGTVKETRQCSRVMRAGTATWTDLNPNDSIYLGDTIDTGSDNYCETDIVMADGTSWELGQDTRWVVSNYKWDPNLSQLVAKYGGMGGVYMYMEQKLNPSPPNVEFEGCGDGHTSGCGNIGIRGTELIWKVDNTAKTMEIDLISGAVAITPAGSTTAGATINAPAQIEVTPQGVKTLPLTQDQYNSLKVQYFPGAAPTS
jgi:hypothetical protein